MENLSRALNSSVRRESDNSMPKVVDVEQFTIILQVFSVVSTLVSFIGIVTNVFNIRAFFIIGLNDGVTISFFALSVSDMFYLCVFLCLRIVSTFSILEEKGVYWFSVDPFVLILFSANTCIVSSFMGMFMVTFLAVARCLCVAMPLHFKNIFTTTRCVAFIVGFVVFAISAYAPIFANMGVEWRFDAKHNASRPFIWFSKDRERIKDIIFLIFDTIIPFIIQFILISCVFVMAYKLRESAKFRQSQDNPKDEGAKLRQRDLRIVRQVLLISMIYIVTNSPKIFNSLYTQIHPEFDLNKQYHYFYLILNDTRFLFECINATANFFVYYSFNSAFIAVCFKRKSSQAAS